MSCFLPRPTNTNESSTCGTQTANVLFGLVGSAGPNGIALVDLTAANFGPTPVPAVPWGMLTNGTNLYQFCPSPTTKVFSLVQFKAGVTGDLSQPANAAYYNILGTLALTYATNRLFLTVVAGNLSVAGYQTLNSWDPYMANGVPAQFLIALTSSPSTRPPAYVNFVERRRVGVAPTTSVISVTYMLFPSFSGSYWGKHAQLGSFVTGATVTTARKSLWT